MTLADARALRPARPFLSVANREEGRALLRLALPLVLIALVNMGMSVTDTAMVSLLFGPRALASVAVGSDLYSILFYLGAGLLGGLSPFYTAAVAAGDAGRMRALRRLGAGMVLGLGLLLAPVAWAGPAWLPHLGLDAALLAEGSGYARAMALTLAPMLGVVLYRTLLTAAERPRLFLVVTLAMLPLNAVANWVLMTGLGPLPAFGPTGAGLSSLLVACASLGLLVIADRRLSPRGVGRARVDRAMARDVLRLGLPLAVAALAELGVWLGATLYAARLGADAVAAHALALRTAGVAYAVPMALLQAAMVRTARARATGEPGRERAVVQAGLGLALAGGLALCLLLSALAQPLAGAVLGTGAVAGTAAGLLGLLALAHLAMGAGAVAGGVLRGRKEARAAMTFVLWGHWALGVPLAVLLCEGWGPVPALGVTGLWLGLSAGMLATAALSLGRVLGLRLLPPGL